MSEWNRTPLSFHVSDTCIRLSQIFLVMDGYDGVGFELCKILYDHNMTIFIAGRSASNARM
ncbi:hypothetical protein BKA67DRAFT_547894 [Truncatella angustata]|uniref:Uncharacterized protein n=1 Tax=Truncatella angustata TaxID=152316 RepID=A0A9P8UXL1_9PEZI|nr:uncharacterized protein BKA67DRAFT_547894 [Truncatella angustata]KAH6660401.1 hypothetical protein BKA67DRAFT_547894 [Truncatella angustata]